MYADYAGAISLSKYREVTPKTKHIDIAYHISQDYAETALIRFLYIPSEKIVEDEITKPLDKNIFYRLIESLGLKFEKDGESERNNSLNDRNET